MKKVNEVVQQGKNRVLYTFCGLNIGFPIFLVLLNPSHGVVLSFYIRRFLLIAANLSIVILNYKGYTRISRFLGVVAAHIYTVPFFLEFDLIVGGIALIWAFLIGQCLYMFEGKMQRFFQALSFLIAMICFIYFFKNVPNTEFYITTELAKKRAFTCMISVINLATLTMFYGQTSNKVFEDVENNSREVDKQIKEKETFFACMSHEIRNPIQSLMGSIELLAPKMASQPETSKLFEILKSCCNIVLHQVNNILDISKLQAGKMILAPSASNAREIVQRVVHLAKHKADEKNIGLQFNDCLDLPPALQVDSQKLSQVVINIVFNAIKFTKEGEIKVSVDWIPNMEESHQSEVIPNEKREMILPKHSLINQDRSPNQENSQRIHPEPKEENYYSIATRESSGIMKIVVEDTGIGISEEGIQRLFKPFSQADAEIQKGYGGTGLGLWISKNIINLMKGDIGVSSRPGVGTTFTISFPAEVSKEVSLISDSTEKPEAFLALKRKKCLILDDVRDNTYILFHLLQNQGMQVETSNCGEEALRLFKSGSFDAVVTDLRMPGMSGQTFIKKIRKFEKKTKRKQASIMVVSAESSLEERMDCLQKCGADCFLLKPIKLYDLVRNLLMLLTHSSRTRKKILILEDETVAGLFIKKIIQENGHEVVLCRTVSDTKKHLEADLESFNIILLDNHLPDGNGRDVVEYLESRDPSDRIHVVSISGLSLQEQRQIYSGTKIKNFLLKPLNKKQLISLISLL